MTELNRIYRLSLPLLEGIGPSTAKKLVSYCGNEEAVFKESLTALSKIPGIGSERARLIKKSRTFERAELELKFIEENAIGMHYYLDENYPTKLKYCDDGPVLLFSKGNVSFTSQKTISIVGTRNATQYGIDFLKKFLEDVKDHEPLIISGLAYGIDVNAHKYSLKNGLQTFGIMAHGLDTIYPAIHRSIAREMMESGGIITEFYSGTKADRENFPKRNRIIAGISDAIIVVESAYKGGSMITADLANQYNRDVFAVPGRVTDGYSEGCNLLIKSHRAHIFTGIKDLEYIMGWGIRENKSRQLKAFVELSDEEKRMIDILRSGSCTIDLLSVKSALPISKTSSLLLNLEFNGLVRSLPGKVFELTAE